MNFFFQLEKELLAKLWHIPVIPEAEAGGYQV
jgi:hypothetical protein